MTLSSSQPGSEGKDNSQPSTTPPPTEEGTPGPALDEKDESSLVLATDESEDKSDIQAFARTFGDTLAAFVNAATWSETRTLLEREHALLLTDLAEQILTSLIEEAQQSDHSNQANHLKIHLLLLREARLKGVPAAWASFEAAHRRAEQGPGRGPINEENVFSRERVELSPADSKGFELSPRVVADSFWAWMRCNTYREERRFLEAHPELLDPRSVPILENLLTEYEERAADIQRATGSIDERMRGSIQILRDHLSLLRRVRDRGSTWEAIHTEYVNAYGGLSLEVPSWLEEVESQLNGLRRVARPELAAPTRVALLRQAIVRARNTADCPQEALAEMYGLLWEAFQYTGAKHEREAQEEGIACLKAALQIYTSERYPLRYAGAQGNLGNAYSVRTVGERRANLGEAIRCYTRALQVFTIESFPFDSAQALENLSSVYMSLLEQGAGTYLEELITCLMRMSQVYTLEAFPLKYARTQANLGAAYVERTLGDRQANLEEAIACLSRALEVYTLEAFPLEYARTQITLGGVYIRRIAGDHQANLEEAIACLNRALQVYTFDTFPFEYATVQVNLGAAYAEQIANGRRTRLEEAIVCYKRALQVFTLDKFPVYYSRTLENLGDAYTNRVAGERRANREEAIGCYRRALQVYTVNSFPMEYATIQRKLSDAYRERLAGDRRANLEEAIACCTRALQVFTFEISPLDYARTQHNLGAAYYGRLAGDRRANLEEAIACYTRALQVFTLEGSSLDYARAQSNLGSIYVERLVGDRRANLEEAIACYRRALQVFTPDAFSLDYAQTHSSLSNAYRERIAGERRANLEEAIACCNYALQVLTLNDYPEDYAKAQLNLGTIYRARLAGERRANLEEAIACYRRALQVFTPESFPVEYATIQRNLSNAYRERIEGEHRLNLEEAIACCTRALQVFTLEAFPIDYAKAQESLGSCYQERLAGDRRANLEEAIACYSRALQVFTFEAFPIDYARTHLNLAGVYQDRVAGERRANLEQAIVCCSEALRVFTLEDFPLLYAMTQHNLGNAYSDRVAGDRSANLEEAIACYTRASQVLTPDAFPQDHASIQLNLGTAYIQRIEGVPRTNLEEAIACLNRALEVYTLEAFPLEYARVQLSLGTVYSRRVEGERSANLEEAIACCTRALQVFTRNAFPADYARLQVNLGGFYSERIEGERRDNLEEAIACYTRALQIFTFDAFPLEHRMTQLGRAFIEASRQDWEAVHDAYSGALAAEDLLVALGAGAVGRDAILKEGRNAAIRDGFALVRLSRIPEAAAVIEHGRARGLAESMALGAADPARIGDPGRRARYEKARMELVSAQAALYASLKLQLDRAVLPAEEPLRSRIMENIQREADLKRTSAYHQAKAAFDSIVAEIHTAQDPVDFLRVTADPSMILQAVQLRGAGHTLVYLAATPWGGYAVAASSADPTVQASECFAALDLPRLTDDLVVHLIESTLSSENRTTVIGGFAHAQEGSGFALTLHNQKGGTFRDRAESLHAILMAAGQASTLDTAAQTVLAIPALAHVVDRPLDALATSDLATLEATLGHVFLQAELRRCMEVLAEVALRPLVTWLREQGVMSMTLIPCGSLAAFPLAAAPLTDLCTVGEMLTTSIAPSARSLLHDERPLEGRSGIYAIGDPRPTHQELRWGEAEAYALAKLARNLGLVAEARVQDRATRDWLVEALHKGLVVDASCHGTYNISEPLQSALFLARGERLTLADMLSHEADLRGLQLLILSACQTSVLDLRGARDEVRSLAAGMLQAGARAVLASLWSVDDRATYLLIVRFAQEWLPQMENEPPASALARAQHWLRTVTNRQLKTWLATTIPVLTAQERRAAGSDGPERDLQAGEERALALAGKERVAAVRGRGNRFAIDEAEGIVHGAAGRGQPDACPYADPIYWAGFQVIGW